MTAFFIGINRVDYADMIIYEDEHIIIVNKPAGLVVHSDGRTKEETLADLLLSQYPELAKVGEPLVLSTGVKVARPGIVHRLDRETSGVMVVARTQEMFENLKAQFKNKRIRKVYHALAYGHFKEDRGRISRAIGRSRRDFRRWATIGIRGKTRDAQTDFRILKQGFDEEGKKVSLAEARPLTGRTHQIRVHFAAVGHPIVGDTLYSALPRLLGMKRCALHACELALHDHEGKQRIFKAPYPDDFAAGLAILEKN